MIRMYKVPSVRDDVIADAQGSADGGVRRGQRRTSGKKKLDKICSLKIDKINKSIVK